MAARDNEPEQYGGRVLQDLSVADDARIVARPGMAGGRAETEQPPGPPAPRPALRGGGSRAGPPPPLPPGWPAGSEPHPAPGAAPRPRPHAYARAGCAGDKRGTGQKAADRPPQRGEVGSHGTTPPVSPPPHRPASHGGAGPLPPEAGR